MGNLIYIPLENSQKIARAVGTGKHPIFCSPCDGELGERFDKPVKEWLSKHYAERGAIEDSVLANFLAPIFWRAGLSNHNFYRDFWNHTTNSYHC